MRLAFYSGMIILLCLVQADLQAQTDSAKTTQFKIGMFHNSDLNYYGRVDSLHSRGSFLLAELWLNRNFYINAAPVFVHNERNSFQYAGTVATAGYRFNDQHQWAGNFYVVKPFYSPDAQLVQSALKAQVAGTLTLQNKALNFTTGGDIKFSDKIDFGVTAGLDHLFRIELGNNAILVIDPSGYLNAGTQQFTSTYFRKSNFLLFPGAEQAVTENVKKFNILSYELSIPVIVAKGKLQFLFIPAYVIPENLIVVPGRPDLSENGRDLFYATVGVKVVF